MITTALLSDALKTFYLPGIINQNKEQVNPFYAMIEKNGENVMGSAIKMAMQWGRSGGVSAIAETGDLPTAGYRNVMQVDYLTKNIVGRISLTDKMMKLGKTSKGAFIDVLSTQISNMLEDIKDFTAKMMFLTTTGTMGVCTVNTGTTTLVLNATPGVKYLQAGMLIDIVDAATGLTAVCTGRTIKSVNKSTNTIEISGAAVTTAVTDIVVVAGSYGNCYTGLGDIFTTTGTIYGKDKTVYPDVLIPTITNIAGEIDELDIQTGIDESTSEIDFMFGSFGVKRAYQYLMNAIRHNQEVMTLAGGYKTITYNGIPLMGDKYCPNGELYLLATKDWKLHEAGDWEWMEQDGSMLSRVTDKLAYDASIVKYADLGCNKISGQTKLHGITEH